jgi:hypothetical protein
MTCNKRNIGMMTDQEFKNKKLKITQLQEEVDEHEKRTLAPIPTRVVVGPRDENGWRTRKLITGDETAASFVYKETEEWCGYGDDRRERWEVYLRIVGGSPDNMELLLKGFQESLGQTQTLIFVRSLGSEEYTKNVYGAVLERLNFVEEDSEDSTVWACDHNNGYVSC